MKIKLLTVYRSVLVDGDFTSLAEALKSLANLSGADLYGADLSGADLSRADLSRANLDGANLDGKKIKAFRSFHGLYPYQVWAVIFQNGERFVRMGCLFYSLHEWEDIGILESNRSEFPNNGSEKSLERKAAFEFAKAAALRLK